MSGHISTTFCYTSSKQDTHGQLLQCPSQSTACSCLKALIPHWMTFNYESATKAVIIMSVLPFSTIKKSLNPQNGLCLASDYMQTSVAAVFKWSSEINHQLSEKASASKRKCTVRKWQLLCPHTAVERWTTPRCSEWESPRFCFINASHSQPNHSEVDTHSTQRLSMWLIVCVESISFPLTVRITDSLLWWGQATRLDLILSSHLWVFHHELQFGTRIDNGTRD